MKRIVLKYGGLGALVLVGTSAINYAMSHGAANYPQRVVVGYMAIFLSMLFVYFGMKQYRKENGGVVTFLQGLALGILISILPAIAIGIFNAVCVKYLEPDFAERYYNSAVQQMRATLPPKEFAMQLREVEEKREMLGNPFLSSLGMVVIVLVIGIVFSAIVALILQRKNNDIQLVNA